MGQGGFLGVICWSFLGKSAWLGAGQRVPREWFARVSLVRWLGWVQAGAWVGGVPGTHCTWTFLVGQLDLVWTRSLGPAGIGLAGQLEFLVIAPSYIIKVDGKLRNDALRHL